MTTQIDITPSPDGPVVWYQIHEPIRPRGLEAPFAPERVVEPGSTTTVHIHGGQTVLIGEK